MLFPAARAEIVDVWHVSGLRGTGSDAFTVTDLFVPHDVFGVARRSRGAPASRARSIASPRAASTPRASRAWPWVSPAPCSTPSWTWRARRRPRGGRRTLRDNHVVQSQVAQAEARIRSARMFLMGSLEEIWREVGRSGTLTMDQRMTIRLAATYAIHQARDVADIA